MRLTLRVTRHAGHAGATLKRRGSIPRLVERHTRQWSNLGLIVVPGPCRSCRRLRSFKGQDQKIAACGSSCRGIGSSRKLNGHLSATPLK
ncbi:hypothetical protein C1X65_22945 [Pseudomonas sp. FW305-70]|nr:hypothetical protein C1X65_22945 [Pseudomonas sp. FW305-70]